MNDNIKYIQETYSWGLQVGTVKNMRDFSKKVGVNYSTISKILSFREGNLGRLSGSSCAKKVLAWREKAEAMLSYDGWEDFRKEAALRIYCAKKSWNIDEAIANADELIAKLKEQ